MEEDIKFQLVLQIPGNHQQVLDSLVQLEETLSQLLDGIAHEVDGMDFGLKGGNVFVNTANPIDAFDLIKMSVDLRKYPGLKAAFRPFDEDEYTLIWPDDSEGSFDLI